MPLVISIEGNIGSGKSRFLSYLYSLASANETNIGTLFGKSVMFVPEPISEWSSICDETGTPMLSLFYKDQKRNAFSFQMMAYISRLVALSNAIESGVDVVITERCLYTDKNVFAKMLYEDNMIREVDYQIYNRWFEAFAKKVQPDHILYLSVTPETCLQRTQQRSRKGEEGIPLAYLRRCGQFHNNWLCTHPSTHILDANQEIPLVESAPTYMDWVSILKDLCTT